MRDDPESIHPGAALRVTPTHPVPALARPALTGDLINRLTMGPLVLAVVLETDGSLSVVALEGSGESLGADDLLRSP
ncbi:MAG TPA: hypothetical protein VLA29_07850 [Acidimicrobiia bacterium]|nr:hypothetical protein [Acidimicrobiia bacterium]